MCIVCAGTGVPVCASGICSANLPQLIHLALLSGGAGIGSFVGWFRVQKPTNQPTPRKQDDHQN